VLPGVVAHPEGDAVHFDVLHGAASEVTGRMIAPRIRVRLHPPRRVKEFTLLSGIPEILLVTRRQPRAGPGRGGVQHLIG